MSEPKTPEYTRKAIRAYEKNLVRKSIAFDVRKDEDMALLELIKQDGRSFAEIVRTALLEHLQK